MKRDYPRQSIEDFGRQLIVTNDLDPIYNALIGVKQAGLYDQAQLYRWLIAYWCFYHAGVASYLSEFEGQPFWHEMWIAATNVEPCPIEERWPRGRERRHFRGPNAIRAVRHLKQAFGTLPEQMVVRIIDGDETPLPFKLVSQRVQLHVGFGPWIGFKVADMIDRVLGVQVDFDTAAVFMFKDPEKAAWMLWDERQGHKYPDGWKPKRDVVLGSITNYLIEQFQDLKAPPLFDRPINIQEVETVLCKWKSHMNGHYPPGSDIHEIGEGLWPWTGVCNAALDFNNHMPDLV